MTATGSCLCGAVTYRLNGAMRHSLACHCIQCRKTSGHYWSSTQVADEDLEITRDDGLVWYTSSDTARRGFCGKCGSNLFWQKFGSGKTSVGSGTLDGDTGIQTSGHIFVDWKGDYYDITDGLPQKGEY